MHLVRLQKHQLLDFIQTPEYQNMPVLPISYVRAIAHAHNPRLQPQDVLLILAYEDQKLVGYLGALPDALYTNQQTVRFAWLSCIWVDTTLRGKGIAKKLVTEMYAVWNECIAITEFTGEAEIVYNRLGVFSENYAKSGMRYYVQSPLARLVPQKKHALAHTPTALLYGADWLVNAYWKLRNALKKVPVLSCAIQYVHFQHPDLHAFLKTVSHASVTARSFTDWEWMSTYPWVVQGSSDDMQQKRYQFTCVSNQFSQGWVLFYTEGKPVVAVMYSLRDGHLRIPYCVGDEAFFNQVTIWLQRVFKVWQVHTFTTYQTQLIQNLAKQGWLGLHKKVVRNYKLSHALEAPTDWVLSLQDGDADCFAT